MRSGQQRNRTKGEPQNAVNIAILAFKPGHSHYFNSEAKYRLVKSTFGRAFNVVDNVQPSAHLKMPSSVPNRGRNVRQDEKNADFLSEVIVTYCPEGGLVYDPYAGTLSTSVASIRMRRRSFSVEMDEECFKAAFKRLSEIGAVLIQRRILNRVEEAPTDPELFSDSQGKKRKKGISLPTPSGSPTERCQERE